MEEFQLSKFTREGEELLDEVTAEFERLGIDTSNLPQIFPDDSGKIKLVFIGQYSAGKSSIIKMLTGADVAVGAAITTQNFTPYEWNGLEIVDTPGIHTELRPDHDEITYEQINHAALLIFVVTNEGFSQRMGDHFRELAINQQRAANMVLVINKMDRTKLGNVPEQQKVIYEDVKKVTEPYDPKDLYISFVDTSSYFKALEETDERRKIRRLERSGYDNFVENLNRFVAQKGVLQKIYLPLNEIAGEIKKAASGDSDQDIANVKAYMDMFNNGKKTVTENKRECLADINTLIETFKTEVTRRGQETVEGLAFKPENKTEDENKMYNAQKRINIAAQDCMQKISDSIKNFYEKSTDYLSNYENVHFSQQVNANVVSEITAQAPDGLKQGGAATLGIGGLSAPALIQKGVHSLQQNPQQLLHYGSQFLGKNSTAMTQKVTGILTSSAGKFIGLGLAGIGVVAAGYMLYRENKKAEEFERQVRQKRSEIITSFNDIADDMGRTILSGVNDFMAQNVDPVIAGFDEKIKQIEEVLANEKSKNEQLLNLLQRTENLIGEIQACQ